MSLAQQALGWATSAAYVGAAILAVRAFLKERGRARLWLAAALVFLAMSSLGVRLNVFLGPRHPVSAGVSILAFAASAYALLSYRNAIDPLRRGIRPIAGLALGFGAGWSLLTRLDPASPMASPLASLVHLGVWSVCILSASVRFWRLGADRAMLERVRLKLLATGYGGTVVVVLVLGIAGHGTGGLSGTTAVVMQGLAFGFVPLLYASVAMPGWLRHRLLRMASLRAAPSVNQLGVWYWDAASDRVGWSDDVFQRSVRDFQHAPSPSLEHLHPDDREAVSLAVEHCIRARESMSVDHRVLDGGGERWINLRAVPVSDPTTSEVVALYGTYLDITSLRRMRRDLDRSNERFERIADGVQELIYRFRLGEDAGFDYVNTAASNVTGCDADAFGNDPGLLFARTHPEDRSLVADILSADPPRGPVLTRWDHPDGQLVWLEHRVVPIVGERGEAEAVEGIALNVTDRMNAIIVLRDQLRQEKEENRNLRSRDRMKDAFLGAVSHDLRSPLSAILGLGETIARTDGIVTEAQTREIAARIVANAERLDRLLDDLLDLERLGGDRVETRRSDVELATLVRQVISDVDSDGRQLLADVPPMVAHVDPIQVERIVENLVRNAVKHTGPHSHVWVSASRSEDGVLITVADDGPGVPDDMKEAIFEPFVRGANGSMGSGVGLSLVARFAELHGGRAWVEDRPPGGAVFRVMLPERSTVELSSPADRGMRVR